MQGRKRGGQPGNENAVTHGRYGARSKAKRRALAAQRAERSREWQAKMPPTDYAAICAAIEASGATKH